MSDIIVKFKPQGHKALINAIKELEKAQKGASGQSENLKKKGNGLLKTNRLLDHSFATMRSHLLLFNFAMGLGIRQMANFGKQAAKVESLNTAFTTLSGGAINASVAIDKLKDATNNTMSEMELFQQANNAMILGVTKNSDEMAEMFDMAQRLGRALGRDAASSVESLVTGIGRQSRLMLDNIGIIVKAEEAYKKYALELKKSEKSLTDSEKRQAFLNATLDAARKKIATLGKETLNSQDAYDQFSAATSDLRVEIGKLVNDSILPALKATTEFINSLDRDKLKSITEIAISLGVAFVAVRNGAAVLTAGFNKIKAVAIELLVFLGIGQGAKLGLTQILKRLVSLKLQLAAAVFVATRALLRYTGVVGGSAEESEVFWKSTRNVGAALNDVNTNNVNLELENYIEKLQLTNEFLKLVATSMKIDLFQALNDAANTTSPASQKMNELTESLTKAEDKVTKLGEKFKERGGVGFTDAELENMRKAVQSVEDLKKEISDLSASDELAQFEQKIRDITGIETLSFFQKGEAQALKDSLGTVITSEEQLLAVLTAIKNEDIALDAEAIKRIATNANQTESNKELAASLQLIKNTIQSTTAAEKENVDNAIANLETKTTLTEQEAKALEILKLKQKSLQIQRKLENNHLYQQADAYAAVGKSILAVGKVAGMHQKDMLALQVIVGIANAYKAASDTWADTTIQPTILRAAAAASHFASAYANVRGIQNQMQKIDSSGGGGSGTYGRFEQGGYVGGRPHSQGGTIIEAERGEFVMSRNAVESIGLETLNQMNQTGGGGNINVSVTGNVLTQDFVEGELAESIKEAVRRGSDFGIG